MRRLMNLRYLFRYLRDPRVNFKRKIWIYLTILYFISPIDLIPEPILGLGFLDDLVILLLTWNYLMRELERYAANLHNQDDKKSSGGTGETIDGVEYKVHDEN